MDAVSLKKKKKIVRSVVLESDHFDGRIVECQPPFATEGLDAGLVEPFAAGFEEVVLVARGQMAHDAPHVVLQVGIEEFHRPTMALRRKTAQHQQPGVFGQEGFERMALAGIIVRFHSDKDTIMRRHRQIYLCFAGREPKILNIMRTFARNTPAECLFVAKKFLLLRCLGRTPKQTYRKVFSLFVRIRKCSSFQRIKDKRTALISCLDIGRDAFCVPIPP